MADKSQVNKGDTLATLETDKVSNELEAEEGGVLNILIPEGEEVDIGTVIATISVGASGAPAAGTSAGSGSICTSSQVYPSSPACCKYSSASSP